MTLVNLTISCRGEPPAVGHFMMSRRGRIAYEIVSMRRIKPQTGSLRRSKWRISCRRWEPKEVPEGASMHPIEWSKR